jgi:hypothetical protein
VQPSRRLEGWYSNLAADLRIEIASSGGLEQHSFGAVLGQPLKAVTASLGEQNWTQKPRRASAVIL